uniref:DUF6824 domain-containing protein n=1 Tax=Leptocylindrus danicus TaxID=163516 RepID=A0A7S2K4C9_9STRA|mmetsp:Transcript_16654/g.24640  ORF Transcript_16654/g.24640 Transcript_16654/m.24640 type:complete len:934 (+) Transcript_16654:145-2946(+)
MWNRAASIVGRSSNNNNNVSVQSRSSNNSVATHSQLGTPVSLTNIPEEERTNVDVLCGTGTGPNQWAGNISYRGLVDERRAEYLAASHKQKRPIAMEIVAMVRTRGGRFLKKDKLSGLWNDIGDGGKSGAIEKAARLLRETSNLNSSSSGSSKVMSSVFQGARQMFFRRTKSGRIVADDEPSSNASYSRRPPPDNSHNHNRASYGSVNSSGSMQQQNPNMSMQGMNCNNRGSYGSHSMDGSQQQQQQAQQRGSVSYTDMSGASSFGHSMKSSNNASNSNNRGSYGSDMSNRGSSYSHVSYGSGGPMQQQQSQQGGYANPRQQHMPTPQQQQSQNPRTAAYVSNSYNMLSSDSGVLREAAMHFLPEADSNQQGGGHDTHNANKNVAPQSYGGYNNNNNNNNNPQAQQHQHQQHNNNNNHVPDRHGFRESFRREVARSKAKNGQQGSQSQRSIKQVLSASARKLGKEVDWNSIRSDVTWDDPAETLGDDQLDFIVDSLKKEGDDIDDISTSLAGAQISKAGAQRHQLQTQNSSLSASSRRSTTALRRGLLRKMSSSDISIHTHNHRSAKHKRNNSDESNVYKPKNIHMMPPPTGLVRSASDSSLVVVPSSNSNSHQATAAFEPIPVQQYHQMNGMNMNNHNQISHQNQNQQQNQQPYNGNSYLAHPNQPQAHRPSSGSQSNFQHLEQHFQPTQEGWSRQSNMTAPDQWHRNSGMSMLGISTNAGDLHGNLNMPTPSNINNSSTGYRSSITSGSSFDVFAGNQQHVNVNVNRLSAMSGLSGISTESWANDINMGQQQQQQFNRQSWRSMSSGQSYMHNPNDLNYSHSRGSMNNNDGSHYRSSLSLNMDQLQATILEGVGENQSERGSFTGPSPSGGNTNTNGNNNGPGTDAIDQLVFAAGAAVEQQQQQQQQQQYGQQQPQQGSNNGGGNANYTSV